MTVHVTVEIRSTDNKEHAQRICEAAGLTVVRAMVKRDDKSLSPVNELVRASALLDIPEGLDKEESQAYIRGYAKGCLAYVKKHGAPSVVGTPVLDEEGFVVRYILSEAQHVELRKSTKQYEWDRHPSCHRAGMAELRRYRSHPARTADNNAPLEVAV